jgi:hypothetical protein
MDLRKRFSQVYSFGLVAEGIFTVAASIMFAFD